MKGFIYMILSCLSIISVFEVKSANYPSITTELYIKGRIDVPTCDIKNVNGSDTLDRTVIMPATTKALILSGNTKEEIITWTLVCPVALPYQFANISIDSPKHGISQSSQGTIKTGLDGVGIQLKWMHKSSFVGFAPKIESFSLRSGDNTISMGAKLVPIDGVKPDDMLVGKFNTGFNIKLTYY